MKNQVAIGCLDCLITSLDDFYALIDEYLENIKFQLKQGWHKISLGCAVTCRPLACILVFVMYIFELSTFLVCAFPIQRWLVSSIIEVSYDVYIGIDRQGLFPPLPQCLQQNPKKKRSLRYRTSVPSHLVPILFAEEYGGVV